MNLHSHEILQFEGLLQRVQAYGILLPDVNIAREETYLKSLDIEKERTIS